MSDIDYQDLERFVKKALDVRDSTGPDRAPDAEMLQRIALKYGLSKEQWQELCEELEEHKKRGKNFASVEDWAEAIKELEQAWAIAPYDQELEFNLACAYARRFEEEGTISSRMIAEKMLRHCIDTDADNLEAVEELERLKRFARSSEKKKKAAIGAAILLVCAAIAYGFSHRAPTAVPNPKSPHQKNPPIEVVKIPPAAPKLEEEKEWTIPVVFPLAEVDEGFSFSTRSSILRRYKNEHRNEESYGYEFKGILKSDSLEIKTMRASLELLDASENILVRQSFDIIPSFRHGILPGDSVPVQSLIFKKGAIPAIKSVRIILKRFERTPIVGEVKEGIIIELLEPKNPISPNLSVELRERLVTRKKGAFSEKGKAKLKLVLSMTNTGNRAIKNLVFQAVALDKLGDPLPMVKNSIAASMEKSGLASSPVGSFTAVYSSKPLFVPGEKRVIEVSILIPDADPDDLGGYDISILEIE